MGQDTQKLHGAHGYSTTKRLGYMVTSEKSIVLRPDTTLIRLWWLLGLLITLISIALFALFLVIWVLFLIPVYGLVFLLWHRKWKKISYTISDHQILIEDHSSSVSLPLAELERVELQIARIPFSSDVGHLVLIWNEQPYRLQALRNASSLQAMIQKTMAFLQNQAKVNKTEIDLSRLPKPGTLENLNDLVGLWQQGLLSDEAFEQEKKRWM